MQFCSRAVAVGKWFGALPKFAQSKRGDQLTDLREMQGNLGCWRLRAARSESQLMSEVPSTSITSTPIERMREREPDDITALAPSRLSLCWNFRLPASNERHGRKALASWSARVRSTEKTLNNAVPAIGSGAFSFPSLLPPPTQRRASAWSSVYACQPGYHRVHGTAAQ